MLIESNNIAEFKAFVRGSVKCRANLEETYIIIVTLHNQKWHILEKSLCRLMTLEHGAFKVKPISILH